MSVELLTRQEASTCAWRPSKIKTNMCSPDAQMGAKTFWLNLDSVGYFWSKIIKKKSGFSQSERICLIRLIPARVRQGKQMGRALKIVATSSAGNMCSLISTLLPLCWNVMEDSSKISNSVLHKQRQTQVLNTSRQVSSLGASLSLLS